MSRSAGFRGHFWLAWATICIPINACSGWVDLPAAVGASCETDEDCIEMLADTCGEARGDVCPEDLVCLYVSAVGYRACHIPCTRESDCLPWEGGNSGCSEDLEDRGYGLCVFGEEK